MGRTTTTAPTSDSGEGKGMNFVCGEAIEATKMRGFGREMVSREHEPGELTGEIEWGFGCR